MTDSRQTRIDRRTLAELAIILLVVVCAPLYGALTASAHPSGAPIPVRTFEDGTALTRYVVWIEPNDSLAPWSCPRGFALRDVTARSGLDGRKLRARPFGDGIVFRAHPQFPGARLPSYRVAVAVEPARQVGHVAIGAEGTHGATLRLTCASGVLW